METPATLQNAEPAPPPVASPPRDYRSFLTQLEDERALLALALDAFRTELASASAAG